MKKISLALALAAVLTTTVTPTFAGILVSDAAKQPTQCTAKTGILVSDFAKPGILVSDFAKAVFGSSIGGILVSDLTGILVSDAAGCGTTERTGILVSD